MRYVYIVLIAILTVCVLVFLFQNLEPVTVSFLTMSATLPAGVLLAAVYALGMLTGGSLLMVLRQWVRKARKADPAPGGQAAS